jgi:hypothetical protein
MSKPDEIVPIVITELAPAPVIATLTALGGSLLGHHSGDYLVQPDWCVTQSVTDMPTSAASVVAVGCVSSCSSVVAHGNHDGR